MAKSIELLLGDLEDAEAKKENLLREFETLYGDNKLPYDQQRMIDDANLRINNARSSYRNLLEIQHRAKVIL